MTKRISQKGDVVMISANTVKCNVCKNRTGNKGEWKMSCKAYPEGIPLEIISSFKNSDYNNCNNSEYGFSPAYSIIPEAD